MMEQTQALQKKSEKKTPEPRHTFRYRLLKTIFMVLGPVASLREITLIYIQSYTIVTVFIYMGVIFNFRFGCPVITNIIRGIFLELAGPTLPDLRFRVGANYEEISRVLVARSAGYFASSFVSGFLADKYADHVELWLCVAELLGSVATAVIPWTGTLGLMGAIFFLQGLGQGTLDTNNNVLCIRLWADKAAAPIHALHFGFGIGAMLAPQIARPWISDPKTNISNMTRSEGISGPIEIPYTISSIITIAFSVAFLCFYIYDRFHEKKVASPPTVADFKRIFSPGTCAGGRTGFGFLTFALILLFYVNVVGGERAYSKFIYSYAIKTGRFTRDSATLLNTVFWLCFMTGRGIAIIAARWVPPKYLISVELTGNVISGIILAAAGYDVQQVLWAFTAIFGLVLAPVFPGGLAWATLHVHMTGMAVAFVFIGGSCGAMVYQWFTGYLFEYQGARTLMYVICGYSIIISIVFILMLLMVLITRRNEKRTRLTLHCT